MTPMPGPVETLARLSLQSDRYRQDPEYRDAVDAVLGHAVFDAAPALMAALQLALRYLDHPDVQAIPFAMHAECVATRARAAIAAAEGMP